MENVENLIRYAHEFREKLLGDPYRPTYHFAIPDGDGTPGDPNGAFFENGRYHLMYLYKHHLSGGYHWGHISSTDLLHWRSHPDALTTENDDKGCYSGGAFLDDDGTAYLTYWKFPSFEYTEDCGGIEIAFSKPPYEKWERMKPIAIESSREHWGVKDITVDGVIKHIACSDPSNIWKANGWYYMQAGTLPLLQDYGPTDEQYKCNFTDLYKSRDMKDWQYVGKFYNNPMLDDDYPDNTEDDMCPSFLPIFDKASDGKDTGKYLQLFISHNKGGQYLLAYLKVRNSYLSLMEDSHGTIIISLLPKHLLTIITGI